MRCGCSPVGKHFNPRSREGSDRSGVLFEPDSLHFNPRSREGSDATCATWHASAGAIFQSTLP